MEHAYSRRGRKGQGSERKREREREKGWDFLEISPRSRGIIRRKNARDGARMLRTVARQPRDHFRMRKWFGFRGGIRRNPANGNVKSRESRWSPARVQHREDTLRLLSRLVTAGWEKATVTRRRAACQQEREREREREDRKADRDVSGISPFCPSLSVVAKLGRSCPAR